jgi:hypothetical protein
MFVIATDLDRTLLPNGNQKYDGSMPILNKIMKNEKLKIIYVTGRNLKLVEDAIRKFKAPLPNFIVGEVGTKIYFRKNNNFIEDKKWAKLIKSATKNWNTYKFKEELSLIKGLRLQEKDKQDKFKLSYYIDILKKSEPIIKEVTKIIKTICEDAIIVYSVDETINIGLLDIIPKRATKLAGLEYLRKKLELKKEEIIYCGDSGNDVLPLTFGYKAILVRNSIKEIKDVVKEIATQKEIIDSIYIARGYKKLNGYYVSGIIEGLIKFNIISQKYAE